MQNKELTREELLATIDGLRNQLALADAGNARLAARCLELEKELEGNLPEEEEEEETGPNLALMKIKLFYDLGYGFSEQTMLEAPDNAYDMETHQVSVLFTLKKDCNALRFDPGELPCWLTNLQVLDDSIELIPVNGITLEDGSYLFLSVDPVFRVEGKAEWSSGVQLAIRYNYYPFPTNSKDPLLRVLIDTLKEASKPGSDLLDGGRANAEHARLADLEYRTAYAEEALEAIKNSTSWKITAPLRALTKK